MYRNFYNGLPPPCPPPPLPPNLTKPSISKSKPSPKQPPNKKKKFDFCCLKKMHVNH